MKIRVLIVLSLITLLALAVAQRGVGWSISGDSRGVIAAPQFGDHTCFSFSSDSVTCGNGPPERGGCGEGSKTTVQFVTGDGRQTLQTNVVGCTGASNCPPEQVDTAVDNPWCCDHDGDTYASIACGGTDCDDENPSINRGMTEICGDGIDNDCQNGDEACPTEECENWGDWWVCMQDHALWRDWPECYCEYTPILIDVVGNGFTLTNAQNGVRFDNNADGSAERLSWTTADSDDAWLVLDRNGNSVVDNGTELFGTKTPQPAPPPGELSNGFLALAEYDKPSNGGNGDGVMNQRDAIFSSLKLWQDTNHNGVSDAGELHSMRDLGLKSIDLDYKESRRTDQYGNRFRYRAKVKDTHGAQVGRWAWDVFLVPGQ